MADVIVVSLYQAQCHQPGCTWAGTIRSGYLDAWEETVSHQAAHEVNDRQANRARSWGRQAAMTSG